MNNIMPYRLTAFLLGCALIGMCAYLLIVQPFMSLNNEHAFQTIRKLTQNAGQLMYGTITSIDARTGQFDFAIQSPYDGTPTTLNLRILPRATIAYQTLQKGQDGTYESLSTRTDAQFSDIPVGSRAAVFVLRNEDDQLATNYILFGNPL